MLGSQVFSNPVTNILVRDILGTTPVLYGIPTAYGENLRSATSWLPSGQKSCFFCDKWYGCYTEWCIRIFVNHKDYKDLVLMPNVVTMCHQASMLGYGVANHNNQVGLYGAKKAVLLLCQHIPDYKHSHCCIACSC